MENLGPVGPSIIHLSVYKFVYIKNEQFRWSWYLKRFLFILNNLEEFRSEKTRVVDEFVEGTIMENVEQIDSKM